MYIVGFCRRFEQVVITHDDYHEHNDECCFPAADDDDENSKDNDLCFSSVCQRLQKACGVLRRMSLDERRCLDQTVLFYVKKYDIASDKLTTYCIESANQFNPDIDPNDIRYQVSNCGRFITVSVWNYVRACCYLLDLERLISYVVMDYNIDFRDYYIHWCMLRMVSDDESVSKKDEKDVEKKLPTMVLTMGTPSVLYYKIVSVVSEKITPINQSIEKDGWAEIKHDLVKKYNVAREPWCVATPEGLLYGVRVEIFYTDYLTNTSSQVLKGSKISIIDHSRRNHQFTGRLVNGNKLYLMGYGVMICLEFTYRFGTEDENQREDVKCHLLETEE
jgi:hypothetical protein